MIHPKLKLLSRKPAVWFALAGNLGGRLTSHPEATRSKRWSFQENGVEEVHFFPSKRAALCWVVTGEKFKTKPVFAMLGGRRSQKRIR